ncbi:ribosomal protection-like ABC-F family protein [Miniphocaeibacter massiliensis]|uniref:ribosomal protection-like ABC-F family protein n=1 Tax=Miniphocaeibacter massiliensis TaxID=2041841 RepID=UPI000C1C4BEE|nr:ABC-F type ribosomal protection protein [Miniphocaeibacter massiliensis]
MSIIDIKNLNFSYSGDSDPIFDNLSLQLDGSWKLGLIGRNGYGKTTFLDILRGRLEYDGKITSKLNFEYFPYEVKNEDYLTIDVVEEIKGDYELWRLEKELNLLNVNLDVIYRPFDTLSGGERTKVLIASMFVKEGEFLLIDEPTNSLDIEGRRVLAKYLNSKNGFILISHDRRFLNETIDHILTIEKKKIVLQKGNYETWSQNKILEDEFNRNKNEKLKKEITRLEKSSREKSTWSDKIESTKNKKISGLKADKGYIGHKAAKMMKKSKTLEKRYNKVLGDKKDLLTNIEFEDDLSLESVPHHSKYLITAENYSVFYGQYQVFKPINFTVKNKDIVTIIGENGAGKSSFLKSIIDSNIGKQGLLQLASDLKISYLSQDFEWLKGNIEDFIYDSKIDKTKFLTLLRKMGFSRDQFDKDMASYSSGQKKKVLIAKSFCEEANIYIWDEPLNYLDIITRLQIEHMIKCFKPTMILVEHDEEFIENIGSRDIEIIKSK